MEARYVSVWFPYLKSEWFVRRHKDLQNQALVLYVRDRGRSMITAVSKEAYAHGISRGMLLADAKAVTHNLHAYEEPEGRFDEVLQHIGEWFIRYSPTIALDPPDGLVIDATGCTHLWGGDDQYLRDITARMNKIGYTVKLCIAGTIGTASAVCRYGMTDQVKNGNELDALSQLPPASLRIDPLVAEKLNKLGLRKINSLFTIQSASLRRRMGVGLLQRLRQALGEEKEFIQPIHVAAPFHERMASMEPILSRTAIEIALHELLVRICDRLCSEQKGARILLFKVFTIDGLQQQVQISTTAPSSNPVYLFKLFELKLATIAPGFGIEVFILDVLQADDLLPAQEKLWINSKGLDDPALAEFLDRITNKLGEEKIARYLPAPHYWPERAIQKADSIQEQPFIPWPSVTVRPLKLLSPPEKIAVTAPIPDYPPMNFRYRNKLHKIIKADGPERMEQEWWIRDGLHRDYYYVEDESGKRYWLFRSGHYDAEKPVQWYLHGFCS